MQKPAWASAGADIGRVTPARVYDALLGGAHNFATDRRAAEEGIQLVPDLPQLAMGNRAFLRRAVAFLVDAGVRQFLDIGSGVPTTGNVHELVQERNASSRVLYVDLDPVVMAHTRGIVAGNERAAALEADLRKPTELLSAVRGTGLIDFDEPVAVLLVAVLSMLADSDEPAAKVAALRDAVPSGSYLVMAQLTSALRPDAAALLGSFAEASRLDIHFRSREAIGTMFDGWDIIDPGLVEQPMWRSESERDRHQGPGRSLMLAGIGRKP